MKKEHFSFVCAIIIGILTLYILNPYTITVISGQSMSPTYKNGNIAIMEDNVNSLSIGDIIFFEVPDSWEKGNVFYIKRIVGKPGDTVKLENDIIYINDLALIELRPFYKLLGNTSKTLKENEYFVIGDNTFNSSDSLTHFIKGQHFTIDKSLIQGKTQKVSENEDIKLYVERRLEIDKTNSK